MASGRKSAAHVVSGPWRLLLARRADLRALVSTHHPRLRQRVALDRRLQVVPGVARQLERHDVERKHRDVISMGATALWRTRATIALATEAVTQRLAGR